METRIPRAEVEEVIAFVAGVAGELWGQGAVEVHCCGSYRRGKADCGDVDLLLCPLPGAPLRAGAPPVAACSWRAAA